VTCRDCQRVYRKNWYEKNKASHLEKVAVRQREVILRARQFVWDYLSMHPCVECGENDPVVLEFDHITGSKRKTVTELAGQGYSLETVKKEIAKCQVLCANCHRQKTSKELGWFRAD
jgi:5-methylcytosine-specific restriction endonuclease McrA